MELTRPRPTVSSRAERLRAQARAVSTEPHKEKSLRCPTTTSNSDQMGNHRAVGSLLSRLAWEVYRVPPPPEHVDQLLELPGTVSLGPSPPRPPATSSQLFLFSFFSPSGADPPRRILGARLTHNIQTASAASCREAPRPDPPHGARPPHTVTPSHAHSHSRGRTGASPTAHCTPHFCGDSTALPPTTIQGGPWRPAGGSQAAALAARPAAARSRLSRRNGGGFTGASSCAGPDGRTWRSTCRSGHI